MNYYRKILGQILTGEQSEIKESIDAKFESGQEIEGQTIYSFESLRIHEAINFLEDNWKYIKKFLV